MRRLPIGIEDFKELIDKEYYYVDKTMLYTRPRRFGKTLNMSRRCPLRRAVLFFFYQGKRKCVYI